MNAINIEVNPQGPAAISMRERDRREGQLVELTRQDPYLVACEEDAYRRLLAAGHRLPAGSIAVTVTADALARYPQPSRVGRAIAQRAL